MAKNALRVGKPKHQSKKDVTQYTSYAKSLAEFSVSIRINFRNNHLVFHVLIGICKLFIGWS